MRYALVLVAVCGCGFQRGSANAVTGDGSGGSGGIDGAVVHDAPVPHDGPLDGHDASADAHHDATTGAVCDPTMCAASSGACGNNGCEITVTSGGDVSCPSGMPCVITCSDPSACDGKVDCGGATSCTINCNADNSCAGMFRCTDVACTLYCRGVGACANSHVMDNGESCDIECCGAGACTSAEATPTTCSGSGTCP